MEEDFLELEIIDGADDFIDQEEQIEQQDLDNEEDADPQATDDDEILGNQELDELDNLSENESIQEEGNIYAPLAEALKEQDFFKNTDISTIKDIESLSEAFRNELKSNEYNDLNERQVRVLNAFRNGIPENEVISYESDYEKLNSITEDEVANNEELARSLIVSDLLDKGISEDRANKMYEIYVDTGEASKEALISLNNKKELFKAEYDAKIESAKKQKEQYEASIQERYNNISKSINDTENFMGSFKVTDKLKEKVSNTMNNPVGYTENGQPYNALMKARMDNPVDFESKLYYLFTITDGFNNLKAFDRKAESKATRTLEEKLRNSDASSIAKPSFQTQPKGLQTEIVDV